MPSRQECTLLWWNIKYLMYISRGQVIPIIFTIKQNIVDVIFDAERLLAGSEGTVAR